MSKWETQEEASKFVAFGKNKARTKGVEEALIVLGSVDLNNKLGYGNTAVPRVVEGDEVRIKFTGMKPTKKGKSMYTFEVSVRRA